jgi:general secretion pathway protein G
MRKRWLALGAIALLLSFGAYKVVRGPDESHAKARLARAQLQVLGSSVEQFRGDTGHVPATLEELLGAGPKQLGPYARSNEFVDPWGNPIHYRPVGPASLTLFTLGADGQPGGSGDDTDQFYSPR